MTASAEIPANPGAPPAAPSHRRPHLVWGAAVFALTALLTWAAFPPFDAGAVAFVVLLPAALWAYRAPRFRPFAAAVLGAQVVAWAALLFWLTNVTWAGWLLLAPFLGLISGSWFLAAWWWLPRLRGHSVFVRLVAIWGLAALWVLIEWFRGWFLGGFPWLPLAASQWTRPLVLQAASIAGAGAVSFVLVAFNLGVAAYINRIFHEGAADMRKRSPEFMWSLMLLGFATFPFVGDLIGQRRERVMRLAFVQPHIPQGEKWDAGRASEVLRTIERTVLDASEAGMPDAIVLPEAVTPWTLFRDPNVQPWLESLAKRTGRPLLLGSVYTSGTGDGELWYNGAFVVDPVLGLDPNGYAKRKLVPFGEYVPLRPVLGWLEKVVPIGGDFTPGVHGRPLLLASGRTIVPTGVLICYEDIFPALARASVREGAELLAVLTNNAWFGEGGAAHQHATHSVLRAVENRRPLVRVGNAGWSGWIDEFGTIRLAVTDGEGSVYFRGSRSANVTRDARWVGRQSFYTERGDWFLGLAAGLAGLGFALLRFIRPPAPPREGGTVF